jgi:hypothetical protein
MTNTPGFAISSRKRPAGDNAIRVCMLADLLNFAAEGSDIHPGVKQVEDVSATSNSIDRSICLKN